MGKEVERPEEDFSAGDFRKQKREEDRRKETEQELQDMNNKIQQTYQQSQQEMQKLQQEKMGPVYEKVRKAIETVGKAGAYTYIFEVGSALYIGTDSKDLTADVKTEIQKIK